MGKNKIKGIQETFSKQPSAAAQQDEEDEMTSDDSWDSDEEEMLNFDDIFGDDCDEESDITSSVKPKVISFQKDIGLSESDIRQVRELRQKKEEKRKNDSTPSNVVANRRPPEIIVFNDPTQRKLKSEVQNTKSIQKVTERSRGSESVPEIDLKAARHEVHRFGLKGLQQVDKDQAMQELLIKLGAKPPKKTYMNYKDMIEKRREETERLRQMKTSKQFSDEGKLQAIQSLNIYKKRFAKKRNGKGPVDGLSTGRSGVHKVRERDVKKFGQAMGQREKKGQKGKSRPNSSRH